MCTRRGGYMCTCHVMCTMSKYLILWPLPVDVHQAHRQGGALAPPFQTEIYKQQHVKWCISLRLLTTHYSLVCNADTWAFNLNCIRMYMCRTYITCPLAHLLWCVPPPFNESGNGPVHVHAQYNNISQLLGIRSPIVRHSLHSKVTYMHLVFH